MRILLFTHSLLSDWNHGNAHFLRGVVTELAARGHEVRCYEPRHGWSVANLTREHGEAPLDEVRRVYPRLDVTQYDVRPELDEVLDGADLVIVHEWNDPALVEAIGARRASLRRFVLLFHDTHHRSVTAPHEMMRYDLSAYDGVLAFGEAVRQVYLRNDWANEVWTWHEAADVRVFRPPLVRAPGSGVVWIGNWGDEERTAELDEFLIEPARELGLGGSVYGVRYPDTAMDKLRAAGLRYGGWLPNYRVPGAFARHAATVHVPRRPYTAALPGIPTIRVFEALACAIPLVSAPWDDVEGLFRPGRDYAVARDGREMRRLLEAVSRDPELGQALASSGLETIRARHTCGHRVDELLEIYAALEDGAAKRSKATHEEPRALGAM